MTLLSTLLGGFPGPTGPQGDTVTGPTGPQGNTVTGPTGPTGPSSLNVPISRTLIDSANFASGDIGKTVVMNKPAATTLTIPEGLMAAGDVIGVLTKGAGQVTIAVATPADQALNTACKTPDQDTMIAIYCIDATANAEVFKVIGGVA